MKKIPALILIVVLALAASLQPLTKAMAGQTTTPPVPAIDLLVAGQDITFRDAYVIHITKREGTALRGIRITRTAANGDNIAITADAGVASPGTIENAADNNFVHLTLHNLHIEKQTASGRMAATAEHQTLVLQK